jgi:hypothetical protein
VTLLELPPEWAAVDDVLDDLGPPWPPLAEFHRLNDLDPADAAAFWDALARELDHRGLLAEFPALWCELRLGSFLWSAQREVLASVGHFRRTLVLAGHALGKSWLAARAAAHHVATRWEEGGIVVGTAPTFRQIHAVLWRELRNARNEGDLVGRVNQSTWTLDDGTLLALGQKPADHNSTTGFQGIHAAGGVLAIADEASGIPGELWDALFRVTTSRKDRLLALGNPDYEGSRWHREIEEAREDPDSNVIVLDVLDSPNFTGEPVPDALAESLASPEWEAQLARRYGRDSGEYLAQVRAQFRRQRADAVIPRGWLEAAREPDTGQIEPGAGVVVGLDVGAGGDETVAWARRGRRALGSLTVRSDDAGTIADEVVAFCREWGAVRVVVDSIGVGFGLDALIRDRHRDIDVVKFDAAARATVWAVPGGGTVEVHPSDDPPENATQVFANARAQLWWAGRERCQMIVDPGFRPVVPSVRGGWDLSVVEDEDPTLVELVAPGYSRVHRSGSTVILIESKDELRKAGRLGRSSNGADALLMAFWEPAPEPVVEPVAEYVIRSGLVGRRSRTGATLGRDRGRTRGLQRG